MRQMITCCCLSLCFVALSAISGCKPSNSPSADAVAGRCPHDIKAEKCPFCTPALIESDGFCGGHGVAEALCYQCRPYLKTAFKAKGDWCKEHEAPDSQCMTCHPELKAKIDESRGHGS